jgi:hypothetical protein
MWWRLAVQLLQLIAKVLIHPSLACLHLSSAVYSTPLHSTALHAWAYTDLGRGVALATSPTLQACQAKIVQSIFAFPA